MPNNASYKKCTGTGVKNGQFMRYVCHGWIIQKAEATFGVQKNLGTFLK